MEVEGKYGSPREGALTHETHGSLSPFRDPIKSEKCRPEVLCLLLGRCLCQVTPCFPR